MNPRTPFVCALARRIRKLEPDSHPLVSSNATLYAILIGVMAAGFLPESVSSKERMSLFALFWVAAWFWNADTLQELLHESEWMRWLAHLPVSRLRSFQILYRRFLNQTFAWAAVITSMTYFIPGVGGWEFLGICFLQFLLLLAASSLFSTWEANIPHVLTSLGVAALGLLLIPIYMAFPDKILLFLPTGWCQPSLLGEEGLGAGYTGGLLLILAVAAVMRLGPIYKGYKPSSQTVLLNTGESFMDIIDDVTSLYSEYDLRPREEIRKEALRDGLEALRENVRSRWWLEPYEWWNDGGFLARFIGARLDQRQKRVVEFLLMDQPTWTRRWKFSAGLTALGTAAVLFLPQEARWLSVGVVFVAAYTALAPPTWSGLGKVLKNVPYFRLHPVAPGELAHVFLKIETIRFAAFLPLLLTYLVVAQSQPWFMAHVVLLLLGLQWYAVAMRFGPQEQVHQFLSFLTFLVLLGALVGQNVVASACGALLSYWTLMRWVKG